jgi:hypothetical protein
LESSLIRLIPKAISSSGSNIPHHKGSENPRNKGSKELQLMNESVEISTLVDSSVTSWLILGQPDAMSMSKGWLFFLALCPSGRI